MRKKNLSKRKITHNTLLSDITFEYPQVAQYLTEYYGLHCIGCVFAPMETIEEGARVHGIIGKDFEELLDNVNKLIEENESKTSSRTTKASKTK